MRGKNAGSLALLVAFLVLILLGRPVAAHSDLVAAEPAPGTQLGESPAEIRLTFSEPIAATSQIVVMGENFEQVSGLVPQFNPERPQEVYTPLPVLEPGVYTVQWVAASSDGHEISGSYSFSVGLGTPDAAGVIEPTTTTPANSRSGWWLGALGLAAVGLPLILLIFRRAGRRENG